jgi:hypothetical protein
MKINNSNKKVKNPFERMQKGSVATLCILCTLLFAVSGCEKQKSVPWVVELKLKPQSDESYLATEDPKIQALTYKYRVKFYQSYPSYNAPAFLLYYTLTGNKDRESTIKDFISTGIFEDNVMFCIHFACGVRFKLKPQTDENYLATEDPEIQALISRHGVALRQTAPGAKNPELLLYYDLSTMEDNREINMAYVIEDFLAMGKFEDDFHAYGGNIDPL